MASNLFILFQALIFAWLVQRAQTIPLSDSSIPKSAKSDNQLPCLICEDEQHQDRDEVEEVNLGTLFEYDKTMGIENLDEIENEVLLINSTTWLQDPINVKNFKQEVTEFREAYQNRTLNSEEAENQLEELKVKANAYTLEKDANKRNALKKWRRLPIIRLRAHKIEQRLLDAEEYGENLRALGQIDEIRNLANEASKALREVYDYYFHMDTEFLESNEILKSVEEKLDEKRAEGKKFRGSRCFWIFCY